MPIKGRISQAAELRLVFWEARFSVENLLSAFRFRKPNGKCAKHRQISNQKIVLNDSFALNVTSYHSQLAIFFFLQFDDLDDFQKL